MEDVLVKETEVGLEDGDGVITVVDDRTCNKGERTGGRDGDDAVTDTDTIAVGVRGGDEKEEVVINGNSLGGLSLIVLSWLGFWEVYAEAVGCETMRCLGDQEQIWIAPKGKPLEWWFVGVICFWCPLRPMDWRTRRRRWRVLEVDSVTDIGSVSGERMGKGPGKGGGTDLTEVTSNSEDTTEWLATDSGSGRHLAILIVDKVRVDHTGELAVGENGG
jgi:hypothetical protein